MAETAYSIFPKFTVRFGGQTCAVLTLLLGASSLGLTRGKKTCTVVETVTDAKFRPGQVWSYNTRPGEHNSTVTILRIESLPKVGEIVHVRIDHVRFKDCKGRPTLNTIQYAPLTRAALDESVKVLRKANSAIPGYQAGYEDWISHCGGAYAITLAELVAADEKTFNADLGCEFH